ncbi:MAG: hypothetical protein U0T75_06665 [Chitinophagales bacterium]
MLHLLWNIQFPTPGQRRAYFIGLALVTLGALLLIEHVRGARLLMTFGALLNLIAYLIAYLQMPDKESGFSALLYTLLFDVLIIYTSLKVYI